MSIISYLLLQTARQRQVGKAQDDSGLGVVDYDSNQERQDMNAAGSVAHLLSGDHNEMEEEDGKDADGVHVEMSFKQEQSERDEEKVDTSSL